MRRIIVLITPPSTFLLEERMFINLGILKVAAEMEGAGWHVVHLDLSGYKNFAKAAADFAATTPAVIFGLTATSPQLPAATKITEAIRRVRKDAKIILGGPHATLVYAAKKLEAKQNRPGRAHAAANRLEAIFDVLVAGDGEDAIFDACEACMTGSTNFIDADGHLGGGGKDSPLFLTDARLEASAYPARHLVDLESYDFKIDNIRASSIIGQLGCPFDCGFCAGRNSAMLRKTRTRSSEHIIAEMVHMQKAYGIQGFMFYDDELNLDNTTFLDLLSKIAKVQRDNGWTWRLRGNVKSQLFAKNPEQGKAMYEAGFRTLLVGFESGSPRILHNIKKMATQEHNTKCLDIARRRYPE